MKDNSVNQRRGGNGTGGNHDVSVVAESAGNVCDGYDLSGYEDSIATV